MLFWCPVFGRDGKGVRWKRIKNRDSLYFILFYFFIIFIIGSSLFTFCLKPRETVCFAILKVKVTMRTHMIYNEHMIVSAMSLELLILLQPNLIGWYILIPRVCSRNIGFLCPRSRSQWWFKSSQTVCQSYIIYNRQAVGYLNTFCVFESTGIYVFE